MKKEKKWNILLLLLPICMAAGVTAAYFSDSDGKWNQVAVGKNTVQIEEEFPDPTPSPGPGDTEEYRKVVTVSNAVDGIDGFNVDCYVRIAVSYNNYDVGRAVKLLGLDTVNWHYNPGDGYYYYQHALGEGEKTLPLFTGFSLDRSQVQEAYREYISDFQINIYAESIERQPGEDYQSAWKKILC